MIKENKIFEELLKKREDLSKHNKNIKKYQGMIHNL